MVPNPGSSSQCRARPPRPHPFRALARTAGRFSRHRAYLLARWMASRVASLGPLARRLASLGLGSSLGLGRTCLALLVELRGASAAVDGSEALSLGSALTVCSVSPRLSSRGCLDRLPWSDLGGAFGCCGGRPAGWPIAVLRVARCAAFCGWAHPIQPDDETAVLSDTAERA